MKKIILLTALVVFIAVSAFTVNSSIPYMVPKGWPQPVYNFKANPLSANKIALGRKLFFDPLLSQDNSISCGSCHLPQTGFTHIDHDVSHGIYNRIGTRNSLALINLAWQKELMWDGAIHSLDVQSLAPITNHNEMDETIENVVLKLSAIPAYKQLFSKAFGDSIITGQHTLQALSQFMLTLVSNNAKYDKVMRNEAGISFNKYEAKGYELFKANCASCHTEPLFTNNSFMNNGLPADTMFNDIGRAKITGNLLDAGKFKVPTLRNIEVTYPYMHDGRFRSLQMVLFHYTNGIHQSNTLAPQLKVAIILSEEDKISIIAFLKTLTDESFLNNPQNQFIP